MRLLFSLIIGGILLPLYSAVSIQQPEDNQWSLDENVTYNDLSSLRTSSITDDESTSVTLTFTDVSSTEFYIRTSTESSCDRLVIDFGDGVAYEYSGEMEDGSWEQVYHDWGWDGEHTVTLTYMKDGSVSLGEDCCWIWFDGVESLMSGDSSDTEDTPEKNWDMSLDHPWGASLVTEKNSKLQDVPYMYAPSGLEDGEESWISYTVEGVSSFTFRYMVWCWNESNADVEYLIVSVDDIEVASFGGRKLYVPYVLELPDNGKHTIKWTYRKPAGEIASAPCVWFEGIEKLILNGYTMSSQYPWEKYVDSEGSEFLCSGTVFDGGAASFSMTIPEGWNYFEYGWKISSEEDHDFVSVYLNDELMNWASGEYDWSWYSFEVSPGDVVRFEYAKDDNGLTSGEDCVWLNFSGMRDFMSIMHLFSGDDESVEETKEIVMDLNTGRDVQRGILDGDGGVSFASGEYPAWVHDENESAMRSAEIARGGESWMSATVVGKGMFSFRWKCTGETLSCYVDGELKETLYGWSDWIDVNVTLENDARHEIKWVFARGEDSSEMAYGWVDGIAWNAPEGWDDPDEPIIPDSLAAFAALDLRPSPRKLDTTNFCERITYDPAWRNAASVVLTVDASEAVKTTESGAYEWKSEKEGLFEMKLEFLDSVGAAIGEPLTASFKIVLDPLPALGENATAEDIASILGGVADGKLKANIVDAAEYAHFHAWLEAKSLDHKDAAKSLFAWLSYALDTAGLVAAGPREGDLKIDSFESSSTDGAFEFTVKLKDIAVGYGALEDNLKKVFDIEGREKLSSGEFSSNAVQINAAQADNGNVKFTVTPKAEKDEKPTSFFFKVKMK